MRHHVRLLSLTILAACGGGGTVAPPPPPPPPPPAPVASVSVTPGPAVDLLVGATTQLTATPRDAQGNALSGRAVTWSSTADAVATVSAAGLVTGVAAGTAQVRATSEGRIGEVNLTVSPVPVAAVTLSATTGTLVPGQPLALTATPRDAQGAALTGRTVTWTSSAEAVATVSATGGVTGVAVGSATITATSEGKSATAAMTVRDGGWLTPAGGTVTAAAGNVVITAPAGAVAVPTAVAVDPVVAPPVTTNLVPGTAYDLGPALTFAQPVAVRIRYAAGSVPAGVPPAELRVGRISNGEWRDLAGSTVDVAGLTATGASTTFSTWGVVARVLGSVTVTPGAPAVAVGNTIQLTAEAKDYHGNDMPAGPATWTSQSPSIATVGATTGVVTGVSVGTAVIAGTRGGKSAETTVTVTAPPPFALASLTAGQAYTCGLTAVGAAWCWGSNQRGQLGDGSTIQFRATPVAVSGGPAFIAITAGEDHTCGLTAAGTAWCWGDNNRGQLGDGTTIGRPTPLAVSGAPDFTAITAGEDHTCGLTATGAAWCWGENTKGQLGDGTTTGRPTPLAVGGGPAFIAITAGGEDHTCGLTAVGAAWCWGQNNVGQLGDGTTTQRLTPVAVSGGPSFTVISAGEFHTCGLTAAGAAWCWGWNGQGQLGDGTIMDRSMPVAVTGGPGFTAITGGRVHTCGLTAAGAAWCWGYGGNGALGNGTTTARLTPVAVTGGLGFTAIDAGLAHTCGHTAGGAAWCWGLNTSNQLGDGTNVGRFVPTRVRDP